MNGGGSNKLAGVLGVICLLAVGGGVAFYLHNKNEADKKKPIEKVDKQDEKDPPPGPLTVSKDQIVPVPFIFWGGDVATFQANGGLETTADSLFGKHGLKCKLTPGDDFEKQVADYLASKTPLLRGTLSMLGQVSDKLTEKPETVPVVFLQLTWSNGDHLVGRPEFKSLLDGQLKGKKIALQEGGPHVGMLNDILLTTQLGWKDITVVWTKDVSGDKGPAELFRKDKTIDACFAISPEMFELTSAPDSGGIESKGDGTKKSVKGAHVVVSTAHMSRSIADVYACRKDFYDANRPWIRKFVAGYLKSCEELVDVKKRYENKEKDAEGRYKKVIKLAQNIWSKDPALKEQVAKDEDVDGLISDAVFVGLPGNEAFFQTKGNLSGFDFKQKQSLRLPGDPSKEPLKNDPKLFTAANFNYEVLRKLGDLHGKLPTQARILAEPKIEPEAIMFSFHINFQPNQSEFPAADYGEQFKRALEIASLFGNTALAVQGHVDPSNYVGDVLQRATENGTLKKKGAGYVTTDDKPFDPKDITQVLAVINTKPGFSDFKQGVTIFQTLSDKRSAKVQKTVEDFARDKGLVLDKGQFRAKGLGLTRPLGIDYETREVAANRRVEFSIIKVPIKDLNVSEFDL
jgi:hypothetical protein